jgi:hypothetical protein
MKTMTEVRVRKAEKETPAEREARWQRRLLSHGRADQPIRDHFMSPAEFERMRKVLGASVSPEALQRAEDEADEDEEIRRFARGH